MASVVGETNVNKAACLLYRQGTSKAQVQITLVTQPEIFVFYWIE